MSSLGEAKGMDFAASWEFITISKEKVRIFYKKKNERRKPFLVKNFPLHRVVLFSCCFIHSNFAPTPNAQHTNFLKGFQSNERCLRLGCTEK